MWGGFDKIYCLTLEDNPVRKAHAKKELDRVGIKEYEMVNGFTPKHDIIKQAYRNKLVLPYPTCFRCKKASCRCENNFLIPAQVACFKSFLHIFEKSVKSPHTSFLMLEDDVEFESYYQPMLLNQLNRNKLAEHHLYSQYPCLLSLGQNYMGNHQKQARVFRNNTSWVNNDHSECNVTFAYNKMFASMALDMFKKYTMTSDTYIHKHLGKMCIHKSMSPRISHDLSWSTGKLKSSIHPKQIFFNHNHSITDKKKELQRVRSHVKRVRSRIEYDNFVRSYINS
jgi:hypothetical protein